MTTTEAIQGAVEALARERSLKPFQKPTEMVEAYLAVYHKLSTADPTPTLKGEGHENSML